jgi:hypothetical protein
LYSLSKTPIVSKITISICGVLPTSRHAIKTHKSNSVFTGKLADLFKLIACKCCSSRVINGTTSGAK